MEINKPRLSRKSKTENSNKEGRYYKISLIRRNTISSKQTNAKESTKNQIR